MPQRRRGSAALIVIIILAGLVLAATNVAVFIMTTDPQRGIDLHTLSERYQLCPFCFVYLTAGPLIFTVLFALLPGRRPAGAAATITPAAESAPSGPPPPVPALRLLALLQQEGRFLDFIAEDLDGYSDEQVGTAVRSIHAGCRKALNERVELQRILPYEDGMSVVIEKGFDPSAIRLTGNVAGEPPFRGTLQHAGWRIAKLALPESSGAVDPNIIAPAEVEIA